MRMSLIVCTVILPLLKAAPAAPSAGPILQMSVPRDALYTPGSLRIDLMAAQAALLAEPYQLRLLASMTGEVVHEQTMTLARGCRTSHELAFPEMKAVSEVRCRAELLLGEELIEAFERPVRLWPPRRPHEAAYHRRGFWAFDPSGVVQRLLSESGIAASNAAFQAVRDFDTPRIVVVGEGVDPSDIQMILHRVRMTDEDAIVVLLRQARFPEQLRISIAANKTPPDGVVREHPCVLLDGLTVRDLMGLLNGARAVQVRRLPGRAIASCITDTMQTDDEVCSYLCVVREENRRILCCQLPSTDCRDPRQMTLFDNLIRFASEQIRSAPHHEATDSERVEP